MKNSNLSKESTGDQCYAPPVCQVYYVEPRQLLCASQTETVDEIEGEW